MSFYHNLIDVLSAFSLNSPRFVDINESWRKWNAFGKLGKVKPWETIRYMSKWVFLHKYDWVEFYI